jgi:hypothetical protein
MFLECKDTTTVGIRTWHYTAMCISLVESTLKKSCGHKRRIIKWILWTHVVRIEDRLN